MYQRTIENCRALRFTHLCAVVLCFGCLHVQAQQTAVVSFVASPIVEKPIVQLADIAVVDGANSNLVSQLRALEISKLSSVGEVEEISRERLEYLLLLVGIDKANVQIEGDGTVVTRSGVRSVDEKVTYAVTSEYAQKYSIDPEDFRVHLLRPLGNLEQLLRSPGVQLRAFPLASSKLGSVTARLGVYAYGRLIRTFTASVEVGVVRTVPVARKLIARNQELEADDFERKQLAVRDLNFLPDDFDLVGKKLTARLNPGDIIQPTHIRAEQRKREKFVVGVRDNVTVVARKGGLAVTLGGAQALDRGRIGDTIRLRNPNSKKVMTARLITADTAVIRL